MTAKVDRILNQLTKRRETSDRERKTNRRIDVDRQIERLISGRRPSSILIHDDTSVQIMYLEFNDSIQIGIERQGDGDKQTNTEERDAD